MQQGLNISKELRAIVKQYENRKAKTMASNLTIDKNIFEKARNDYKLLYEAGYGFKILARCLNTSYSKLRTIHIKLFKLPYRKGNNICTDKLKLFRKLKALNESKTNTGFCSVEAKENQKIKSTNSRGVQGYYWNKTFNKYVWLRSSYEYIYAKWLDDKKIPWDVEVKTFKLNNGSLYRPNFFIYDKDDLKKYSYIVEIKGHYDKYSRDKHEFLKKETSEKIILVNNIKDYIVETSNIYKELAEWKRIRKLQK